MRAGSACSAVPTPMMSVTFFPFATDCSASHVSDAMPVPPATSSRFRERGRTA